MGDILSIQANSQPGPLFEDIAKSSRAGKKKKSRTAGIFTLIEDREPPQQRLALNIYDSSVAQVMRQLYNRPETELSAGKEEGGCRKTELRR